MGPGQWAGGCDVVDSRGGISDSRAEPLTRPSDVAARVVAAGAGAGAGLSRA